MKKHIIPTALILLVSIGATAQSGSFNGNAANVSVNKTTQAIVFSPAQYEKDPITEDKSAYYTEKSKKQKSTAWVLLGGGSALISIGLLIGNRSNSSFEEAGIGIFVGSAGVAACIGSIPLFISARKYKAKATLSFSFQKPAPFVGKHISALSLKIPFG